LFSYRKIVNVSRRRQIIEIKTKSWWRWERPIRIDFSRIDFFDLVGTACQDSFERPTEIYDLVLLTKNPSKRVYLFRFGSISSHGPLFGEMAEACADLIAGLTNIRFAYREPYHQSYNMPLSDFRDKYICTSCGHQLHPNSEVPLCPYCGGKEIRIE